LNTRKPYFLHVPRSGGTAIVANLSAVLATASVPLSNGNPVDSHNNWIPFWEWEADQQRLFSQKLPIVCNERMIGSYFDPGFFDYFISIRDPRELRRSLISYRLSEFFGIHSRSALTPLNIEAAMAFTSAAFPYNLLTWMLAATSPQQPATIELLAIALQRITEFTVFRLDSLPANFESKFGINFNATRGRHASRIAITDDDFTPEQLAILHEATVLDYELLSML
jgi:hypothetical protein